MIVRLFNTIGPRQTGQCGMVVPRFVRLALAGEPIPVHGEGTQRRSFTSLGDIIRAMLELNEHPKAYGEVFNIGHTKEISIYDLAVLVKVMTSSPPEIILVPYEEAYEAGFEDMPRRVSDISKIPRCWSGGSEREGTRTCSVRPGRLCGNMWVENCRLLASLRDYFRWSLRHFVLYLGKWVLEVGVCIGTAAEHLLKRSRVREWVPVEPA